jgi:hypothetical protein
MSSAREHEEEGGVWAQRVAVCGRVSELAEVDRLHSSQCKTISCEVVGNPFAARGGGGALMARACACVRICARVRLRVLGANTPSGRSYASLMADMSTSK